jgi:glycosyltransferase involved in cell wall biosynthesis
MTPSSQSTAEPNREWFSSQGPACDQRLASIGWSLACSEGCNPPCTVDRRDWLEGPRLLDVDPTVGDSISYEGTLPANQLAALMAEASILAIPTFLFEVAPVILAEAWAMRLPVVASAAGGIPGLASGAAVFVPPRSASKLAERLIGVLRGYARLDALVAEGRRRAESHSSRAVGGNHLSLYSKVLREHG